MLKFHEIRRVHVEITTRCNARCPMCMRNYRGMDYNSGYPICELSLADFQHIFTPEVLASIMQPDPPVNGRPAIRYQFQGFSFNGNLGDFGSAKDGLEIVQYLVQHNVPVRINTNGSVRSPAWWAALAHPNVVIGFAIDGLADTHALYRQDTDWHRIIENAQAYIAAGGNAVWRFVPFDHNRHQESQCRQMAQDLGFTRFENIYDGRDRGPAFDRKGQFSHHIGVPWNEGTPDVKPLLEHHVGWYNAKTVNHPNDVENIEMWCSHQRDREIYVAADGSVYPCCFLGFYPQSMQHPGNQELAPMIAENNALQYSLDHCMQWFDQVEASWQKASIADGRTFQCVSTCARPKS